MSSQPPVKSDTTKTVEEILTAFKKRVLADTTVDNEVGYREAIEAIKALRRADMAEAKKPKSITEWWIATQFFAQGGRKVAGPFKTRKTALKEREQLERKGAVTYAIDSTKRKQKQHKRIKERLNG